VTLCGMTRAVGAGMAMISFVVGIAPAFAKEPIAADDSSRAVA